MQDLKDEVERRSRLCEQLDRRLRPKGLGGQGIIIPKVSLKKKESGK